MKNMAQQIQDSLRKRYGYKLGANLAGYAIGLVTAGIIPRGLGPKAYGDFSFLTNFFSQVVSFFDMGSSTAFYIKLSQRQREVPLVRFYGLYMMVVGIIVLFLVSLATGCSLQGKLWPEQRIVFIYLSVLWALLNWTGLILNQMTDGYGLTVSAEVNKLWQKIVSVGIIAGLYAAGWITLGTFFAYQFVLQTMMVGFLLWIILKNGIMHDWNMGISRTQIKSYVREFSEYCHPLAVYSMVCLLTGLFDRWILQKMGGSVEQGFYGFAYQIGALCFLFTGAMTPLFMREFSIAAGAKDREKMIALFRRYVPFLYAVTAFFACFVAVQADRVIAILGGKHFHMALLPVVILAFYPLHQTYGQLSGSVFLATGQTKLYRNIGIVSMVAGLPLVFFLVATQRYAGFGLGAVGLAIKMVGIQLLIVNIQLYYNAQYLGLNFMKYVFHQIGCILCLLCVGAGARFLGDAMFRSFAIGGFLAAGCLYSLFVFFLFTKKPIIFGVSQSDAVLLMQLIRRMGRTSVDQGVLP